MRRPAGSAAQDVQEFDGRDGEIDTKEINDMMVSLGLLVGPIVESDEGGDARLCEIDFEEFFAVMKKQVGPSLERSRPWSITIRTAARQVAQRPSWQGLHHQ